MSEIRIWARSFAICNMYTKIVGKEKTMHFVLLYENQSSYSESFFFFVFCTDEAFLKSIPAQV